MNRKPLVLAGTLLVVVAECSLLGQDPADPLIDPQSMANDVGSFGPGTQDLWVDSAEFASHTGSGWAHTGFGYRYNNTGAPIMDFVAPIDLPAGARITAITCYFYDTDAIQTALVTLQRGNYNSATNVPGGGQIGGFIQSVGTLGYQPSTVTYNETVRRREGTVSYFYSLAAHMTAASTLRLLPGPLEPSSLPRAGDRDVLGRPHEPSLLSIRRGARRLRNHVGLRGRQFLRQRAGHAR